MHINLTDILPRKKDILGRQGIPADADVNGMIEDLVSQSMETFIKKGHPVGMMSGISVEEFAGVFSGTGLNHPEAPLRNIYPRAERLAIYAITMGKEISTEIEILFDKGDFPLASMLDTVASVSAENATELYEKYFMDKITKRDMYVLSYSPGYCGWHISAQGKLFEYLHPEKIGISLNDSYLMTPIKSVTGVLVAGKKEIHVFKNDFEFCSLCKDKTCIERMKSIARQSKFAAEHREY